MFNINVINTEQMNRNVIYSHGVAKNNYLKAMALLNYASSLLI
jgi:hypothetical protein